jgi:eukaryotic-like serine/threonine-protein kinase
MRKGSHPKKIGRYTLLGPIGRGGMSIVYRAVDPERKEIVALKYLFPLQPMTDLMGNEKLKNIFTAEARKMKSLNHPNIVKVLDLELESRTPYFTMEYHCTNIGMMINENFILEEATRIINPEKALGYGFQILEGLLFIHAAGITHRDIKPHNVLVTDTDRAKICDFGTAMQGDEETFDSTGLKVGSPYYIAPEQSRNSANADQRSDLYSVAVMLYRLLTGELPGVKSIQLNRINPIFGKSWDEFFSKALEQEPALRYQDAQEMTAALMTLKLHLDRKIDSTCQVIRRPKPDALETLTEIRTRPTRVAGIKAREAFQVNELWQPEWYTENIFSDRTEETVLDKATGLIWQRKDNGAPVNHAEADSYIEILNDSQNSGISTWRLPTINELLTLVNDPKAPESSCPNYVWQDEKQWYWSCDLRSENTSWYVNTRLGYTGWQENSCRNYVRAVASLPAE